MVWLHFTGCKRQWLILAGTWNNTECQSEWNDKKYAYATVVLFNTFIFSSDSFSPIWEIKFVILFLYNCHFNQFSIQEIQTQLEEEQRNAQDARDAAAMAERRVNTIQTELDEVRSSLETAERARKASEAELYEANDHVNDLSSQVASMTSQKRKLEADIQAMQVIKSYFYVFGIKYLLANFVRKICQSLCLLKYYVFTNFLAHKGIYRKYNKLRTGEEHLSHEIKYANYTFDYKNAKVVYPAIS